MCVLVHTLMSLFGTDRYKVGWVLVVIHLYKNLFYSQTKDLVIIYCFIYCDTDGIQKQKRTEFEHFWNWRGRNIKAPRTFSALEVNFRPKISQRPD